MQYVTFPQPETAEQIFSNAIHRAIEASTLLAPQKLDMQDNGDCLIDASLYGNLPRTICIDVTSIFNYYNTKWSNYSFPPAEVLVNYALAFQGDEVNLDGWFLGDFDEYVTEIVQTHFGLQEDEQLTQEQEQAYIDLLYDCLEATKTIVAVLLGHGVPVFYGTCCYELVSDSNNVLLLKLKTKDELYAELT